MDTALKYGKVNAIPDWSPDGRYAAFDIVRGPDGKTYACNNGRPTERAAAWRWLDSVATPMTAAPTTFDPEFPACDHDRVAGLNGCAWPCADPGCPGRGFAATVMDEGGQTYHAVVAGYSRVRGGGGRRRATWMWQSESQRAAQHEMLIATAHRRAEEIDPGGMGRSKLKFTVTR